MKKKLLLIFLFNISTMLLNAQDFKTPRSPVFIMDAHNDVLSGAVAKGFDISQKLDKGNTDLPRLKAGGVNAQVFVVFCNGSYGKGDAFKYANAQLDSLEAIVNRNHDKVVFAGTKKEVRRAVKQGKIAALIGVEGGHMIEDSLELLEALAKRGMRYMTLTWNNSTSWASSAADETRTVKPLPPEKKGLTEFGKQVVRKMNELDVVVDLSHVGETTFYDALKVSTRPVIVSHGNAWSICPVSRNLKDEQIKAVAEKGGVIGVTFYAPFLDAGYNKKIDQLLVKYPELTDSLTRKGLTRDRMIAEFLDALPHEADAIRPSVSAVADHIDYIASLAGIDHVGLGGDYYGMATYPFPKGMADVTGYSLITKELMKRGYSRKSIKKIMGGNLLRVLIRK